MCNMIANFWITTFIEMGGSFNTQVNLGVMRTEKKVNCEESSHRSLGG